MINDKKIRQAIYNAIDEVNADFPVEKRLEKSKDTVLFGKSGKLDSLGLVSLIIATEQQLEELYGVFLTLADEKALSQRKSPFSTVSTLVEYISMLLKKGDSEHE